MYVFVCLFVMCVVVVCLLLLLFVVSRLQGTGVRDVLLPPVRGNWNTGFLDYISPVFPDNLLGLESLLGNFGIMRVLRDGMTSGVWGQIEACREWRGRSKS